MYKRVNKQTGEERVGTFKEIADLDVRIWTRPVPAGRIEEPTVLITSEVEGKMVTLPIAVRSALNVMNRGAATLRIVDRYEARERRRQREILFRQFNIRHWAVAPY
jgi:hypothetical protein